MKKSDITVSIIQAIAVIALFVGIICFMVNLSALSSGGRDDAFFGFVVGLSLVIWSPFVYGFSYIVEAACKYLELTKEKEPVVNSAPQTEVKEEAKVAPAKPKKVQKLTVEDRIENLRQSVETGALTQEEFEEEVKKIRNEELN